MCVCVSPMESNSAGYGAGFDLIKFIKQPQTIIRFLSWVSDRCHVQLIMINNRLITGAWTFLWFVCFCLMVDQWSKTQDPSGIPTDAVHAAIAFSFFSIGSWGALSYFALVRFRQGVADVSQNYADLPADPTSPYPTTYTPLTYPSFQNTGPDVYQQPS
ncbi:synaptogyrin-2-like [Sinocyclocheilus grahami]|uniref:synaptogyrin-2-like n=1 Tax=Sinocyclocheilus grahami TaxID=75366 RepID=UPI0007AD3E20|nr:PREDICTED: synaptogyrin-2-like [Sinocyclocheilus grahami]